jgi:F-type H+-transporting ATPase subunit b
MSELFSQLGIDWRLLLSQAANFLLLLIVLRIFAYQPILKLLKDRRAKIEAGLVKAKEADERLGAANQMVKDKMKAADAAALDLMKETETNAKAREAEMMVAAHAKEAGLFAEAEVIIKNKAAAAEGEMYAEAAMLVKRALAKVVEMDPKAVDETLIKKAIASAKNK